jgi:cytoskeletal protein CcmA (bactofilin family)
MAESSPQQEFSTVIGPDVQIKGSLTFEKPARIHGQVEGTITTPGRVLIAREGKVVADIEAAAIIVEGDVQGGLTATERLELKATAHCEGDVRAAKLTVDSGAVFSGHVTIGIEAGKDRSQHKPQPAAPAGNGTPRKPEAVTR